MEGLFYSFAPETIVPGHAAELRKGEDSKARLNLPPVDPINPCTDRAKREGLGDFSVGIGDYLQYNIPIMPIKRCFVKKI